MPEGAGALTGIDFAPDDLRLPFLFGKIAVHFLAVMPVVSKHGVDVAKREAGKARCDLFRRLAFLVDRQHAVQRKPGAGNANRAVLVHVQRHRVGADGHRHAFAPFSRGPYGKAAGGST